MGVQRPRRAERPEAPDVAEQLPLRPHARRLGGELAQERVLLLREHRRASRAHAPRGRPGRARARRRAGGPRRAGRASGAGAPRSAGAARRTRTAWRRSRRPRARSCAPGRSPPRGRRRPAAAAGRRRARRGRPPRGPGGAARAPSRRGARRRRPRGRRGRARAAAARRASVPATCSVVPVGGEVVGEERARRDVVLDDQDGGAARSWRGVARGRAKLAPPAPRRRRESVPAPRSAAPGDQPAALASTLSSRPGKRASRSSRRSLLSRAVPSCRCWITPASRSTLK